MKQQKQTMKSNQQNVEQQQNICRQCNQIETADNPFRGNIEKGWDICFQCFSPQIQLIIQGIYLGNQDAAMDIQTIQKYQIRAICVCGYLDAPFTQKKMLGKFENIAYIKYDIGDFHNQKIIQYFDSNYEWIEKQRSQGRNVLIHCAGGVSRSASFTIAYLMKKQNLTYSEAYEYVKKKRKSINPNLGFISQLKKYQQNILSKKPKQTVENQNLMAAFIVKQAKQEKI